MGTMPEERSMDSARRSYCWHCSIAFPLPICAPLALIAGVEKPDGSESIRTPGRLHVITPFKYYGRDLENGVWGRCLMMA